GAHRARFDAPAPVDASAAAYHPAGGGAGRASGRLDRPDRALEPRLPSAGGRGRIAERGGRSGFEGPPPARRAGSRYTVNGGANPNQRFSADAGGSRGSRERSRPRPCRPTEDPPRPPGAP